MTSNRKATLRRFAKFGGVCLVIIACIEGCSYAADHYITEHIDNIANFSNEPASRKEIEDFLFDATILVSDPPLNSVTYFDKGGNFFEWYANGVKRGSWSLYPMLDRRTYNEKSRFDVVYSYCREYDDGSLKEDNCFLLESTKQLLSWPGADEYERGDIFDLSRRQKPPFDIYGMTRITLSELRARLSRQ
jgi:hypothetical protein